MLSDKQIKRINLRQWERCALCGERLDYHEPRYTQVINPAWNKVDGTVFLCEKCYPKTQEVGTYRKVDHLPWRVYPNYKGIR